MREEQKAQTRERILRAAAGEFALHGYAATSFSSIAAAMGQPKSALSYAHFRSKEELAGAVVDRQAEVWERFRRRAEKTEGPGLPQLLSVLLTAALDSRTNVFSPAVVRLILESRRLGTFRVPDLSFSWFEYADAQMLAATRAGQFQPCVDTVQTGRLIITASFGLFEAQNHGFHADDTESSFRDLWRQLLTGAGAQDPDGILRATRSLLDGS
ncbi:TetR/AcrR family transcriptional regulator [Microbacterium betulae]|uniref:TetR/AcrR family transcriptional regulator n=1 Tax=Microbacterium betulae TaxID=2981139 RepID=A0AA97FKY6_9MICO|nr:TetR/AcrR family transcriptional regulator [Microbacterium sp. AB]WOF24754.1 TetR/AcrR family transcriptional regulator [Microbacterium sp. AB]